KHPAPPVTYTLSLPDALPILTLVRTWQPGALEVELLDESGQLQARMDEPVPGLFVAELGQPQPYRLRIHWSGGLQETEDPYAFRSEEHTSELQSRENLVCRLL